VPRTHEDSINITDVLGSILVSLGMAYPAEVAAGNKSNRGASVSTGGVSLSAGRGGASVNTGRASVSADRGGASVSADRRDTNVVGDHDREAPAARTAESGRPILR
jgi:hypothetical protein